MGRNKYFFIDKAGHQVFSMSYAFTSSFSDGYALIGVRGRYSYIDPNGEVLLALSKSVEAAGEFKEGLAPIRQKGLWGYINKLGEVVITPQFSFANSFSEGFALVWRDQVPFYIDYAGQSVLVPKKDCHPGCASDAMNRFSEGLVRTIQKGKIGYMDCFGRCLLEPKYLEGWVFSEGLARVRIGKTRAKSNLAFINKTGEIVINTKLSAGAAWEHSSTEFSEGVVGLTEWCDRKVTKHEWIFINKTGEVVFETDYDCVLPFSDGLAAVYDGKCEKWGYIDKTGKTVIEPVFDAAGAFVNGIADVSL